MLQVSPSSVKQTTSPLMVPLVIMLKFYVTEQYNQLQITHLACTAYTHTHAHSVHTDTFEESWHKHMFTSGYPPFFFHLNNDP